MNFSAGNERRIILGGIGVIFIAGLAWLWWLLARDPKINFLSGHGDAAWIIYPKPPNPVTYNYLETAAEFRRSFPLHQKPASAKLSVRAFRRFAIKINGAPLPPATIPISNWKDAAEFDVAGFLREGTNDISVLVFNSNSPPALWLSLDAGGERVISDTNWDTSLLGAAWRPAWPASVPLKIEKGNPVYGGEYTVDCLRQCSVALLCFALLASAAAICVLYLIHRAKTAGNSPVIASRLVSVFVIVLCALWAALFINNVRWLPRHLGYDEGAHDDYINFIRTKKTLPLANQGWEMYQPPLYYLAGAAVTSACGADAAGERAAVALRLLGLLVGAAHIVLIFLCLRRLFPGQPGAQWFGVTLAACLPAHLYISQYITNEFLAAALVTGSLYFCLRLLGDEAESPLLVLGAGLCLGAALLTKITAVIALPFILAILLARNRPRARAGKIGPQIRALAVLLAALFAIAGWHYLRVWKHFGTPFVNNWDRLSGFTWWADNGFQTARYFSTFGKSLIQPRYSSFHGYWDGLYSTFWGDSLDGGNATIENRSPWNYPLMTAGFLLALLPTAVILLGFVASVIRFLRRPESAWFLLLGIGVATWSAVFYMTLKLPYYSQAKAFYALMTLLPVCACAAAGWQQLHKYSGRLRPVIYIAAGIWALNAYASFWVRGGASVTDLAQGNYLSRDGRSKEAIAEFKQALSAAPHNVTARVLLAVELSQVGDLDASMRETKAALSDAPDQPSALMQLALLQAAAGHLDDAIKTTQHITEVDPDFVLAYEKLSRGMMQLKKYPQAIAAARNALRITPYRAEIHFLLGFALNANGEPLEASQHFQLASNLKPSWAEAHYQLALTLAALGRWTTAIAQFKEACRFQPANIQFLSRLGQACAEAGQFDDAVASATEAIKLAEARNDTNALALSRKMLESFQSHRPFHPETPSPAPRPGPAN